MKKVWLITLVLFASTIILTLWPLFPACGADVWKIKFSTAYTPTSHFGREAKWYFDYVEANSKGRIKADLYYGGAICKYGEELKALRAHTIDAALMGAGYAPAQVPLLQLFELTYLTTAVDAAQKAVMDCYNNFAPLRKQIEDTNAILVWSPPVTNNSMWTPFLVPNIDALKGEKIRAYSWSGDVLTRFGAIPAAIVWGDVYNSAKTGVIDGVYGCPLSLAWDSKIYEVGPHVTQTGCGVFGAMAFVIRKDLYEQLPPDLKKLVVDAGIKAQEESIRIVMGENKKAVDDMITRKVSLTVWSPEEIAKAKALVQPAQYQVLKAKLEKMGMGGSVQQLWDMYLEALRKYEKTSKYMTAFQYWSKELAKK
jgi:TRAP-type C4-dicarboxylate transport system substrate-binding protein